MRHYRTYMMLAALTALFAGAGFQLGGEGGMVIALIVAAALNVTAYWNSDKIVLKMYKARPVTPAEARDLYGAVERLAQRAELPMPALYIIDTPQPNAFATGRNPENAAVAVTEGLLKMLGREELEGVIAHELAHIKNRDTLTMTITATLAGAISMLANFALFFRRGRNNPLGFLGAVLVMIMAPLAAMLVQMAISRTREYAADRMGAEISGKPLALASALDKLQMAAGELENPAAEENPATAHLFIVNPLRSRKRDSLFSTHPSTPNRIAQLQGIAQNPLAGDIASPIEFPGQKPSALNPFRRSGHFRRNKPGPWG